MSKGLEFEPIGWVRCGYKEKFGVPRQPGLAPSVESVIEFESPYNTDAAFRELNKFSHIWIIFVFHQVPHRGWQPTVRPPRLGGNERVGVFASRSPFRPNPVGLSVVKLLGVECRNQQCFLRIAGGDMVDGTPVLDIKPYIPYADSVDASSGYVRPFIPANVNIEFADLALTRITHYEKTLGIELRQQIVEILQQDPRPAYREDAPGTEYGMRLYNFNLRFQYIETGHFRVTALEP